jgi:hypothetical protein
MHWRAKLATRPMPMNNEKIYGVGEGANYSAGDGREAVRRFWRNLFAGAFWVCGAISGRRSPIG